MPRSTGLQPARTYPSKVGRGFIALLALSGSAAFAGLLVAGLSDGPLRAAQGFFILLGVGGLLAWIARGTFYTLSGDSLLVRSGPFRWTIPLGQIKAVRPAQGLLKARSSPALSFDRLEIVYGQGQSLLISPVDQESFLADLRSRQYR